MLYKYAKMFWYALKKYFTKYLQMYINVYLFFNISPLLNF